VTAVIIIILSLVTITDLALVLLWLLNFKEYQPQNNLDIKVSVLIAARNEAATIAGCLNALIAQDYPASNMEIIVGDDMSTDATVDEVKKFCNVRLVQIKKNTGMARGKTNVLAQLVQEAQGDVFLITDADVRPGKQWIKSMVSYLTPSVGIVNGTTGISNHLFQHYEWLFAQGMIKVITDLFYPVTAMGNNMLVTRKAYESTGGYENIAFSVTEDFALFQEVKNNGFTLRHVMSPGVFAYSLAAEKLTSLLQQRKRWMKGAVQLPWWVVLLLFFQGIYFPALIVGLIFIPELTLILFVFKFFLQFIFLQSVSDKLRLKLKGGLLLYEFYSGIISILTMLYYVIPFKLMWKGRTY
jgi:cellulose synthase/poly-beta-1,6-N-acetylglucosamine synthase-like glycosyltransferase